MAFQVQPSDLKYGKCSSGISYFGLLGPLLIKVETVHLNTVTRGSDYLV